MCDIVGQQCVPACAEYLFPAANLMAKQKEDSDFSLSMVPHAELYVALNARCSTKASRQVHTLYSLSPILCTSLLYSLLYPAFFELA